MPTVIVLMNGYGVKLHSKDLCLYFYVGVILSLCSGWLLAQTLR